MNLSLRRSVQTGLVPPENNVLVLTAYFQDNLESGLTEQKFCPMRLLLPDIDQILGSSIPARPSKDVQAHYPTFLL